MMLIGKLEDNRLWKCHTDQLKLQEQSYSSEPEGRLPSNGEVDYDPDIPLLFEEHFSYSYHGISNTIYLQNSKG